MNKLQLLLASGKVTSIASYASASVANYIRAIEGTIAVFLVIDWKAKERRNS